ncbi:MAG: hypothetical protein KDK36_06405 [Leptospiraceae bacterium]|nr:hypothetical protein [Leptospiraceae bacterium]
MKIILLILFSFTVPDLLISQEYKRENSTSKQIIQKTEKDKFTDKKFSFFFHLTRGNGYGMYNQQNEPLKYNYLLFDVPIQAYPYTVRNNFKGNKGEGTKIGFEYRRNKNYSFSFSFSNDSVYFRSIGIDSNKLLLSSIISNNNGPIGHLFSYTLSKYYLFTSTINVGGDYYFYSNNKDIEVYAGGEFGLGNYFLEYSGDEQLYNYLYPNGYFDASSIKKLNIRVGIKYNFGNGHNIKIEPYSSYFPGERVRLNIIGVSIGYMYSFGLEE